MGQIDAWRCRREIECVPRRKPFAPKVEVTVPQGCAVSVWISTRRSVDPNIKAGVDDQLHNQAPAMLLKQINLPVAISDRLVPFDARAAKAETAAQGTLAGCMNATLS